MMERLSQMFDIGDFTSVNLIEILIVAYLIYRLLLLIRGTRAVQALMGIIFLLIAYEASRLVRLQALHFQSKIFAVACGPRGIFDATVYNLVHQCSPSYAAGDRECRAGHHQTSWYQTLPG